MNCRHKAFQASALPLSYPAEADGLYGKSCKSKPFFQKKRKKLPCRSGQEHLLYEEGSGSEQVFGRKGRSVQADEGGAVDRIRSICDVVSKFGLEPGKAGFD